MEQASAYGRIWLHLNGDVGRLRSRVCRREATITATVLFSNKCVKNEVVLLTETYWYLI